MCVCVRENYVYTQTNVYIIIFLSHINQPNGDASSSLRPIDRFGNVLYINWILADGFTQIVHYRRSSHYTHHHRSAPSSKYLPIQKKTHTKGY